MNVVEREMPSPDVLAELLDSDALRITVREHETVCVEGEASDGWWYVIDGYADVTRDGRYLATIGPDETIGEISMLDGRPRTATVTATTTMTLAVGCVDELLARLEASPALALAMIRRLARRFRDLSERAAPVASSAAPSASAAVAPAAADAPVVDAPERVSFNPFAPGYFDDPHEQLGRLREQEPVHFVEMTGGYLIHHEHVNVGETASVSTSPMRCRHRRSTRNGRCWRRRAVGRNRSCAPMAPTISGQAATQQPFTPKRIAPGGSGPVAVADRLLDQLAADVRR
ncbi:MAG: Crp/Fnr family transcriptional regulator [Ilumatobacteraceae bacterium]